MGVFVFNLKSTFYKDDFEPINLGQSNSLDCSKIDIKNRSKF